MANSERLRRLPKAVSGQIRSLMSGGFERMAKIPNAVVDQLHAFNVGWELTGNAPEGLENRTKFYWGHNHNHRTGLLLNDVRNAIQPDTRYLTYVEVCVSAILTYNLTSSEIEADKSRFYSPKKKEKDLKIIKLRALESITRVSNRLFPNDQKKLGEIIVPSQQIASEIPGLFPGGKDPDKVEVRSKLLPLYNQLSQIFSSSPRIGVIR